MAQNLLKAAVVLALTFVARGASGETLGAGWPFRRPLTVTPIATDAPGENVAWVEFYANGAQKRDGSDLRVTTGDRVLVPHRLMQASGDSDLVRLAFATRGDGPFIVWWGNPQADMLQPLEIHRGVLLEISRLEPSPSGAAPPARGPATTSAATAVTPATRGSPPANATSPGAPRLLASYLLPNFGMPYNPFSDQRLITFHYAASFKINPAITAQIQLGGGTGWLEIDGKAVRLGGAGTPTAVTLSAGWHNLDLRPSSPSVTLSWQRPGEKTFTPFPPMLFAPVAHATAGSLQRADGSPLADIVSEPAAEVALTPGTYGQRYTFEASFPEDLKPTLQWSFGDGQSAADLRKVNHIFLSTGTYPVSVKMQAPGGKSQETTVRIAIKDRMFERMPKPPIDAPATVRAILKDYNLERIRAEDAFTGMQCFESLKDADLQLSWARAWLSGRETLTVPADEVVLRETIAVARLQSRQKNYRDAAETFRLAAAKPISMETRIDLIRHEIMTLCDDVNDASAALKEAQAWLPRIVPTNPMHVRIAQVALAYAFIGTGDGKSAKAAIDAATAPQPAPASVARGRAATTTTNHGSASSSPNPSTTTLPEANKIGRATVEDALTKKDFDGAATLLALWELADPQSLWTGASRLERGKLLAADHRYLDAARIATQHVGANPEGPHAAELLLQAAENYQLGGEAAQAQATMDQLRRQYPDSAEAHQGLVR